MFKWFKRKKREVKFIAAVCPNCGNPLEMDINMEIAYCASCGLRCVIDDNFKRNLKLTPFDKILGFVERQQNILREDRKIKEIKRIEKEKQDREDFKKTMIILGIVMAFLFTILIVMSFLEG